MESRRLLARKWCEHGDATLIAAVLFPMESQEVALLQLNRHQNVGRGHYGEKEVPSGHGGCTPESDNKAEIERMPYKLVRSRSHKSQSLKLFASQEAPHLLETK